MIETYSGVNADELFPTGGAQKGTQTTGNANKTREIVISDDEDFQHRLWMEQAILNQDKQGSEEEKTLEDDSIADISSEEDLKEAEQEEK